MAVNASGTYRSVVYVTSDGQMSLRHTLSGLSNVCRAARTLKARYFVTIEEIDMPTGLPKWGVFDMRTAQENTPYRGEWSINDPVKTFVGESPDAAIMWAVTLAGKP